MSHHSFQIELDLPLPKASLTVESVCKGRLSEKSDKYFAILDVHCLMLYTEQNVAVAFLMIQSW